MNEAKRSELDAPDGSVDDLVNGLRHIADDHECCRQTIELVIERLEHQDLYLRSAGCADTLEDARRRADKGIRSPNVKAIRGGRSRSDWPELYALPGWASVSKF